MKLLKEISRPGRSAFQVPAFPPEEQDADIPGHMLREEINLPELSEVDIVRHYTNLSRMNFGVDNGFYPLGSCTMKYNPKINEDAARLPGFNLHPRSPDDDAQGCLRILFETEQFLCALTGMEAFSLQPAAGAHGELTGIMIIKAYFGHKGEKRTKVLIPDSAHGTNPASVSLCGFESVAVASNPRGGVDLDDLKSKMDRNTAGLMLTIPNTLGLFDENILEITRIIHEQGGLCYMDGANMNALLGIVQPASLGFDVMHLNLHKTFSTPHGGGGPGAGPVGVGKDLAPFLPVPRVVKKGDVFSLESSFPRSVGKVHAFHGNFAVIVRAYAYIRALGPEGLKKVSEIAVLNANYMKEKLKRRYHLAYDRVCLHEFVLDDSEMTNHVTTNDISKRLIDYGFHPPTVYFPLIVPGAIMIEPTETESRETLDEFITAMIRIREESETDPDRVKTAPHTAPLTRLDAVLAARKPVLTWNDE
ncbi:MAG: aminomethyl-transferring glycine dehydrogenase subunit GcvPB [Candidatus Latescibacterota bacterium]